MRYKVLLPFLAYTLLCVQAKLTEDQLKRFLQNTFEKEANKFCNKRTLADLNFCKDLGNKTKEEILTNATLDAVAWERRMWENYFKDINPSDYTDPFLKRQVRKLRIFPDAGLDKDKLKQLTETKNKMRVIPSTEKMCSYHNQGCNLTKEGLKVADVLYTMRTSTDLNELVYTWKGIRAGGTKIKKLFTTYVTLSNEGARANNFSDKGALWRDRYEDPNFAQNMDYLWMQVEPLYAELHKYMSIKLKLHHGGKIDVSDGLIPDHIFFNHFQDLVKPFSDVQDIEHEVSWALGTRYTVLGLFQKAERFFLSLGLLRMSMCYDERFGAMIYEPSDGRQVVCHADSWDLCDGKTFVIKMCTYVTYSNFITIHHEMGHIQYFLQYKNQPHLFRGGPNPGFHEAIGDTLSLSVVTPTHLTKIRLLRNYTDSYEASINFLAFMAWTKVAYLPLDFIIDKWRWDVFNGTVPENKWNSLWWEYKRKYPKVKPPVQRSDETDLDPGMIEHVAVDDPYMKYFYASILQFQIYRRLCIAAKQYNPENKTVPLHKCDFYRSREAGNILRNGMKLGSSKHWSETLEIMTGSKELGADALLEYFEPFYDFLKAANEKYDSYLKYTPKLKANICNLEWKGRQSQNFKIANYPSFACVRKYSLNIASCEQ